MASPGSTPQNTPAVLKLKPTRPGSGSKFLTILFDGKPVGHLDRMEHVPDRPNAWSWTFHPGPPGTPSFAPEGFCHTGSGDTLEGAKEGFREVWEAWRAQVSDQIG